MKQLLSIFIKRLLLALGVVTLAAGALLLAKGKAPLIGALFLGYAAALMFVWNMAWRLWRLTIRPQGGKGQMMWGMAFRILLLFLVLLVAAAVSAEFFLAAAAGFLICYGLSLFLFIHMNLGKK